MSPDRRNLLDHVWRSMYTRTCRCGRCDCASSDPVRLARILLVHWSIQYRELAHSSARRAEGLREIAKKSYARHRRIERKTGRRVSEEHKAYTDKIVEDAERFDRTARRMAHATVLFERLSRGLHPFRPEAA